MKASKILTVFLTAIFLSLTMVAIPAFAASTTEDGLEVTLFTDKKEYSQGEQITAILTVKNTGEITISNVSLENIVPVGYKLVEGSEVSKQVENLEPGNTVTHTVTYIDGSVEVDEDKPVLIDTDTGIDKDTNSDTGTNTDKGSK